MSFWSAILSEAGEQRTLWFVVGVLGVVLLVRLGASQERVRLRRALLLFASYLVLLPIAAHLRLINHSAYPQVRVALLLSEAVTIIGLSAILLFGLLLPKARLDVPQILRDVLVAGTAVVAFFAIASQSGFNISGLIATSRCSPRSSASPCRTRSATSWRAWPCRWTVRSRSATGSRWAR